MSFIALVPASIKPKRAWGADFDDVSVLKNIAYGLNNEGFRSSDLLTERRHLTGKLETTAIS